MKPIILMLLALVTFACGRSDPKISGRWYSEKQVTQGALVFKGHCVSCHGIRGAGILSNWRKPLADGSYSPPPINGTAHAWHHSLKNLKKVINIGGVPFGGKMPAFKNKLSAAEKEAVIAFFQNEWDDKIYQAWLKRGGLK